jgi:hypothetical protein
MSALYIGAGTDTDPIIKCPDIKTFYYVDCQPNSEFGLKSGYFRPHFISNLNREMIGIGMQLIKTEDNVFTYSNGDQTVYYYTNTALPDHNDKIKNLKYDTLIVAGYHPHPCVLENNDHKLKFIGFENTCYSKEEQETLLSRSYVTNKVIVQDTFECDMILINRMVTPYLSECIKPFYKVTDNDNIKKSTSLDGKNLNDDEVKKTLYDNTAIFGITTNKNRLLFLKIETYYMQVKLKI